jgi:hypothetical protein
MICGLTFGFVSIGPGPGLVAKSSLTTSAPAAAGMAQQVFTLT